MQRTRKIPTKPNFSYATQRAYEFLLEQNITELPIDPFKLIEAFDNDCYICSWSELKHSTGENDPFDLKINKAEAKTQVIRGSNDYMIVYDDSYSDERIRWTIAHEIGHILLGHLIFYDATALNRGGLSLEEYGVLEVEAHWFAGILLSPHAVLNLYGIKESQNIAFLCNISKQSADKCQGYLENFRSQLPDLESKLIRNFYNFFFKNDSLQSITNGIYKFYNSYLYDSFYNICRICRNCKAYIVDRNQDFCQICGDRMPNWDFPFKEIPDKWSWRGYPKNLEGKYYPYIEIDNSKRVLYCPICKNHDFDDNASYCKVCGTPLYNTCLSENIKVSGECRYCYQCGESTKFQELNIFNSLKEVELPNLLSFKNGKYEDYIEYEYWDYIKATIYYWEHNLELYSVITSSKAIIDDNSFVIFAANATSSKIIKENKSLIIQCINKYGHSIIDDVEVYYDL